MPAKVKTVAITRFPTEQWKDYVMKNKHSKTRWSEMKIHIPVKKSNNAIEKEETFIKKKVPNTLVIASITSFWSRRSFSCILMFLPCLFNSTWISKETKNFFYPHFFCLFFQFQKKEKGFITSYYLHIFEWMSQNIVITMEIKWQNYCVNEAMWQQRFFFFYWKNT